MNYFSFWKIPGFWEERFCLSRLATSTRIVFAFVVNVALVDLSPMANVFCLRPFATGAREEIWSETNCILLFLILALEGITTIKGSSSEKWNGKKWKKIQNTLQLRLKTWDIKIKVKGMKIGKLISLTKKLLSIP